MKKCFSISIFSSQFGIGWLSSWARETSNLPRRDTAAKLDIRDWKHAGKFEFFWENWNSFAYINISLIHLTINSNAHFTHSNNAWLHELHLRTAKSIYWGLFLTKKTLFKIFFLTDFHFPCLFLRKYFVRRKLDWWKR